MKNDRRNHVGRYWAACFFLMVFGLLVGCGSNRIASYNTDKAGAVAQSIPFSVKEGVQWPDKDLEGFVRQYWALRKAGNAEEMFKMEAPHVREMVLWEQYKAFNGKPRSNWKSICVEKIRNVTDKLVDVDIAVANDAKEIAFKESHYRDLWLSLSGQWVHVLKDPFLTGDLITN